MFGFGSEQKLQKAEMALQQALAQYGKLSEELNDALRERDAYLRQRDIALGSETSSCDSAMNCLAKLSG
jgi:hypothetical protein